MHADPVGVRRNGYLRVRRRVVHTAELLYGSDERRFELHPGSSVVDSSLPVRRARGRLRPRVVQADPPGHGPACALQINSGTANAQLQSQQQTGHSLRQVNPDMKDLRSPRHD